MEGLPSYISITFYACVITTFAFLFFAVKQASDKNGSTPIVFGIILVTWIFLIVTLTAQGFYLDFESKPPRMIATVAILVLVVISLFLSPRSRELINKMPITTLTYIHIVRVPVEIVLWWLFLEGVISETMTFEGMNYDILSGISAPFAGIFLVGMRSKSRIAAIIWNLITMGLLINIVGRAILVTPYFFDPLIHDKPNLAVFYLPFSLLPTFVVPTVLFCHLASLYQLFNAVKDEN